MTIFLSIIGTISLILIIANLVYTHNLKQEINTLFTDSIQIIDKKFTYAQLENLPDPVQRYFKNVLKENQPYISFVRLKHDGQFKTGIDKNWANIKGEQYFTTATPGFVWKGKIG